MQIGKTEYYSTRLTLYFTIIVRMALFVAHGLEHILWSLITSSFSPSQLGLEPMRSETDSKLGP